MHSHPTSPRYPLSCTQYSSCSWTPYFPHRGVFPSQQENSLQPSRDCDRPPAPAHLMSTARWSQCIKISAGRMSKMEEDLSLVGLGQPLAPAAHTSCARICDSVCPRLRAYDQPQQTRPTRVPGQHPLSEMVFLRPVPYREPTHHQLAL